MTSEPGMQAWLASRADIWRALPATLADLERKRDHTPEEALHAIELYRSLGRDLSIARRTMPGARALRALEHSYARLHAIIYRPPRHAGSQLLRLFRDEIPDVVAQLRTPIVWIALLLVLSAAAGWLLIASYPEAVTLFASEEMINGVEHGRLWTEGMLNIAPSSVISLGILSNNIAVSLAAFCVGVFFGLGTFYIVALNGFMLGGMFAFTHHHGLAGELLKFVTAHGVVELSVIVLAAAAGVMLGEALVRPTHTTRRESFQHAAMQAGRLLILCALLLIGCGFIEGYLSPDPDFPMISRVIVGFGYGVVMIGALTGALFGRGRASRRSLVTSR